MDGLRKIAAMMRRMSSSTRGQMETNPSSRRDCRTLEQALERSLPPQDENPVDALQEFYLDCDNNPEMDLEAAKAIAVATSALVKAATQAPTGVTCEWCSRAGHLVGACEGARGVAAMLTSRDSSTREQMEDFLSAREQRTLKRALERPQPRCDPRVGGTAYRKPPLR